MRRRAALLAFSLATALAAPPSAVAQEADPGGEEPAPLTPTSGDAGPDQASCLPAGGEERTYPVDESKVAEDAALVLGGGGWGHGVGMSQFGANGAAHLGCTTATILQTYYPGTELGVMPSQRDAIAVHLLKRKLESTTIRTTGASAGGVDLPWNACDLAGTTCETVAMQPPGSDWLVTPVTDGTFVLSSPGVDVTTCPVTAEGVEQPAGCHWRGGDVETRLRMVHDGTVIRVVEASGRRVKWGFTEFDYSSKSGGTTYVTQYVTGDDEADLTALDRYLWGLAEMPSGWEPAALRVQAIAGRSYAEATIATRETVFGRDDVGGYIDRNECRCDLFATTVDQVYRAFDHESIETGRWREAVNATRGTVLVYEGKAVAAFYSSSHGGSSEDVEHVWGTHIDYLPAVDTSRWEAEATRSDDRPWGNTRDRWTASFSASDLAARLGFGHVETFEIVARGPGGRPTRLDGGGVRVTGTSPTGTPVTLSMSGETLRSKLSLYSSMVYVDGFESDAEFSPSSEEPPAPDPQDISASCPEEEVPEDGAWDAEEGSSHEFAIDCAVWWEVADLLENGSFEGQRAITRAEMAGWLFSLLQLTELELPEDPPNAFTDDEGNPHEFAINTLAYMSLVNGVGDGLYAPAGGVSRAQMASFFVRLVERVEDAELDGEGNPFGDDDGTVHEPNITKLGNAGIAAGIGDGNYGPALKVSRAQMGTFVARILARLVTGERIPSRPPGAGSESA